MKTIEEINKEKDRLKSVGYGIKDYRDGYYDALVWVLS